MSAATTNAISRKLDSLHRKGAMRLTDVASILGTGPDTISRWNAGQAFPRPDTQRRLLDLEYIVDELSDFYSPDDARLWLLSPQKLLDGAAPADMIHAGRADEVMAFIDQLRDGTYL